jgi:Protein of unknown function (DUF559)
LILNQQEGDKHKEAKKRIGEIHGALGHIVSYEVPINAQELKEEFGHDFVQADILVMFSDGNALVIYIDGENHQGKGTRAKDKRKDEYLITKGFMVARLSTEDALTQPRDIILEDITYQAIAGPLYT